ncbi:MAG: NAD(P)-dependent oxidoreductase [Bacteroidota bacterium]
MLSNQSKILITGSSGHSGNQIAALLKEDFEIVGIDLVHGEHTQYIGSLTNNGLLNQAIRGVDFVIHTASLHAPHVATHSREDFIDTNIVGTLNLLKAAKNNQAKKFVYTSTTSLYGESMVNAHQAVWITEDLPTIPRDIYDITKIAAEGLCRDFFDKNGMQTTVLRVSRFWDEPLPDRVFYRMYRGLDVRDVAAAHQLAIEKDFSTFDVFNISAQSIFGQNDLVDLKHNLHQLLHKKIPDLIPFFQKRNWPIPGSIDRVYVIEKAKHMLGYTPTFNIHQMLNDLSTE